MNEETGKTRTDNSMTMDAYGQRAYSLAVYPRSASMLQNLIYPVLKLNGEAGEVAEKVGKVMRDDDGRLPQSKRDELVRELGDVLWYINACALELNSTLDEVAKTNLDKLFDRKDRGVLSGSGDNR
jgi:NTP pyrophosphatase (non-canonical NTP hydrolase)